MLTDNIRKYLLGFKGARKKNPKKQKKKNKTKKKNRKWTGSWLPVILL